MPLNFEYSGYFSETKKVMESNLVKEAKKFSFLHPIIINKTLY